MKSWTVKAVDKDGKVQYEQEFKELGREIKDHHDAEASARSNARRIEGIFPECTVTVTPSE